MRAFGLLILLCLGVAPSAQGEFAEVLVQWNGRVMSVESCARHLLLRFSGQAKPAAKDAPASWLADVLFHPEKRESDPLFLIEHPDVFDALGLEASPRRRVSPVELMRVFPELHRLAARAHLVAEEDRNPLHEAILRTEANATTYLELNRTFAAYHPSIIRPGLGGEESLAALKLDEDRLLEVLAAIQDGSTAEADTFVQAINRAPAPTHFPIRPASPWRSPSDLLEDDEDTPFAIALLQLAESSDQPFQDAAARLYQHQVGALPNSLVRRAELETFYHRLRPMFWAKFLYGVALLALLLGRLPLLNWSHFLRWAKVLVVLALGIHTTGLLMRIGITGRPPVTNLHGTFLFVGWAMVLMSLILERRFLRGTGWFAAAAAGLGLLLVAGRWAAEGDSLGVLVAVLDSNFWLSTHVIAITLGYAGVALAGLFGHVCLWQSATGNVIGKATCSSMDAALRFGLLFTFLGTVLGGVWADQSWGRFWGWDPKENGALLLILWTSILFHARLAGWLPPQRLAVGCILGILVLLFAWLGTNLLGVGLHAYGFTSGVARWLVAIVAAELVYINACLFAARINRSHWHRSGGNHPRPAR